MSPPTSPSTSPPTSRLAGSIFPVAMLFLPRWPVLGLVVFLGGGSVLIEIVRRRWEPLNRFVVNLLRPLLKGWLDEKRVVLEILTGVQRAGAEIILTYHAKDVARWLKGDPTQPPPAQPALVYSAQWIGWADELPLLAAANFPSATRRDGVPISRMAISAPSRFRVAQARVNRPDAVPWLVIVTEGAGGESLYLSGFLSFPFSHATQLASVSER